MAWFRLYSEVIDDPKVWQLDGASFKFWVGLLALANQGETRGVLPGPAEIAFRLRMDEAEAVRLLDDLTAKGLLDGDDERTPHNWDRRQFASDDVTARTSAHKSRNARNVPGNVPPSVSDATSASDAASVTEGGAGGNRDDGFSAFWSLYPKRVGKGAAEKAWSGAVRAVPAATVLAGLRRHLPALTAGMARDGGKYVPHPATWLNQSRWEDDVAAPVAAPQPPRTEGDRRDRALAELRVIRERLRNGGTLYEPGETGVFAGPGADAIEVAAARVKHDA